MRAQVLGVDALHTRDVRHTHRLLVKHLLAVRAIPLFALTKAVLIFECALPEEMTRITGWVIRVA